VEVTSLLLFYNMKENLTKSVQYFCAVVLVLSSITLAFIQVLDIDDVANGTLMYIAQAFLLAGSIFGLDYYIRRLAKEMKKKESSEEKESGVA
jgi:hypothetical protein